MRMSYAGTELSPVMFHQSTASPTWYCEVHHPTSLPAAENRSKAAFDAEGSFRSI